MTDKIERLIAEDNWKGARAAIEAELRDDPECHWLITRLALTYYEEFDYEKALEISMQALAIVPECPLALWDYAGALDMLKRWEEAEQVCSRLLARGIVSVAHGDCGEGTERTRGLFADCEYRRASCLQKMGAVVEARAAMIKHHAYRDAGAESIYSDADVDRMDARLQVRDGWINKHNSA